MTGITVTDADDFLLPVGAVVADSNAEPFVWVVDEESMAVAKQPVTVGAITGDRIIVKDGIEGGQAIAMSGVHLLTDGMQVTELKDSDETRK